MKNRITRCINCKHLRKMPVRNSTFPDDYKKYLGICNLYGKAVKDTLDGCSTGSKRR